MNAGQADNNGNGQIIRFRTNMPVEVPGIKYPGGRPVQSQYGDQVLITFVDGTKAYLPSIVDARIKELGLKLAEPFVICRREVTEGRRKLIRWEVQRPLADQLQMSIDQARDDHKVTLTVPENQTPRQVDSAPAAANPMPRKENQTQINATPAPAVTANGMTNALKFAIDAAVEATAYAQSKGLALAFDSDSIRTLAVTVFINAQGGHR